MQIELIKLAEIVKLVKSVRCKKEMLIFGRGKSRRN